jgi:hypothetical protein
MSAAVSKKKKSTAGTMLAPAACVQVPSAASPLSSSSSTSAAGQAAGQAAADHAAAAQAASRPVSARLSAKAASLAELESRMAELEEREEAPNEAGSQEAPLVITRAMMTAAIAEAVQRAVAVVHAEAAAAAAEEAARAAAARAVVEAGLADARLSPPSPRGRRAQHERYVARPSMARAARQQIAGGGNPDDDSDEASDSDEDDHSGDPVGRDDPPRQAIGSSGGGGGPPEEGPSDAELAAQWKAGRHARRAARMAALTGGHHVTHSFSSAAHVVELFTGVKGSQEIRDFDYHIRRYMDQLNITGFRQVERHVVMHFARGPAEWYGLEKETRVATGVPEYQLDTYERILGALRQHYGTTNEDDDAVREFHAGAVLKKQSGEDFSTYMVRLMAVRDRLPVDRASNSDFVERILSALQAAHPVVISKIQILLRTYRAENRQQVFPLHTLRAHLVREQRDLPPHQQAPAAAPTSGPTAMEAEVRLLKEALAKSKKESAGQSKKINQLKGAPGASSGSTDRGAEDATATRPRRVYYPPHLWAKILTNDLCGHCGLSRHTKVGERCTGTKVDLTDRLEKLN